MYNRNSDHALNKRDADAIVYQDAGGNTIRLTREDFASRGRVSDLESLVRRGLPQDGKAQSSLLGSYGVF